MTASELSTVQADAYKRIGGVLRGSALQIFGFVTVVVVVDLVLIPHNLFLSAGTLSSAMFFYLFLTVPPILKRIGRHPTLFAYFHEAITLGRGMGCH